MRVEKERDDGLRRVLAERGMAVKIATELGITPQAINNWKRVPVERVLEIERITGVPRHVQRPDIYPVSEKAERDSAAA